jgi:hypothetical protein
MRCDGVVAQGWAMSHHVQLCTMKQAGGRAHVECAADGNLTRMRCLNLPLPLCRIGPVRVGDTANAFRNCIDSWAIRFMDEVTTHTHAQQWRAHLHAQVCLHSGCIAVAVRCSLAREPLNDFLLLREHAMREVR